MIRLFVDSDLAEDAEVGLRPDQGRYLTSVMRRKPGDEVLLFNGRDGEWLARVMPASRGLPLAVERRTRAQAVGPDLDVLIAVIKRPRLEVVAEKAAELGAARVRLVVTERSQPGGGRIDRLAAIATEAAEQTGRLDVPAIEAPRPLAAVLGEHGERRLLFCDEAGDAPPILEVLRAAPGGAWTILIGPEGGFSPTERAAVRAQPMATPVSLGQRILRADTAAIAALALWQATLGDWGERFST